WAERPSVVVSVPSIGRPQLVASLAEGLASVGRLDNVGPLDLNPSAGPLNHQVNSAFRVADVWERFAVPPGMAAAVTGNVVLLVDDQVDSRWTMTVAARLLRRAGAAAVLPFALAAQG
ncbi:MAG TPA: phosphoribosyltransferase, partial [Propionibacteriaceae bacterium]|nr:phosphoribosyltransferase [Propionibacteriaceae bacterium]